MRFQVSGFVVKIGKRIKAKGKRPRGRQAVKPGSIQKRFRLFFAGFLLTLLTSKLLFFPSHPLNFLTSKLLFFSLLSSVFCLLGSRFWVQRSLLRPPGYAGQAGFWVLNSDICHPSSVL